VKAATIGIHTLADYSVWLKDCQHTAIMTLVDSVEVSTLYPCVVISSPFNDWKTSMLPCS
jgi:hypothetical protein